MKERNVLSLTLRGVVNNNADNPEGLVPSDYSSYQIFEKNDLVFKLIDLENIRTSRVGLVHERGIMSPAYVRLTHSGDGSIQFFYYQFYDLYLREIYNQLGAGVRATLGPRDLLDLPVAVPPTSEQLAIARFLNYFEIQVRRIQSAKRRKLDLLGEMREAIIFRAVTCGLDPNARLEFSSIDWMGETPTHWTIRRVKDICRIKRGKFSHRPRNDPDFYDGPYPFIQTGEVARMGKYITSFRQTLNDRGLGVSKMFAEGTLLMTIAANIGDVSVLAFDACIPDSIVGIVPDDGVERDFLYYLFRAMKAELLREAPINTQGNLNVDRLGSMGLALPPQEEQRRIVQYIEESTAESDRGIAKALQEMALLREYRSCLITDVITGKFDVRDVLESLPEGFAAVDMFLGDEELEVESAMDDDVDLEDAREEVEA